MFAHYCSENSHDRANENKLCGKPPNMPHPLQVENIFVFIRQVTGLFRHVGYLRHQQQVLTFDI